MMKPIIIYRKENKLIFELANDFTGKLAVTISNDPVHFSKPEKVLLHFEKGTAISGLVEKERIFYRISLDGDSYFGAERRVPVSGLYNCRDLGGYETVDGRLTRWGLLYRSDAPDHLEKADTDYLQKMTIASVIDLRSPAEIALNPDIPMGEKCHYNFDPHASVARKASETPSKTSNKDRQKVEKLVELSQTEAGQQKLIDMQQQMVQQMKELVISENAKKAYRDFLQVLLRGEVPDLFHCQGGKDRTGWAAAIILSLLGVDRKTIYQDYFLTDQFNRPRNEKRMAIYKQYTDNSFVLDYLGSLQQTKAAYLDSAFQTMEEAFGDMVTYAKEALGLTQEEIQKLKELYLYE